MFKKKFIKLSLIFRLDPTVISDVIEIVTKKCHVSESLVRNAITTKCSDENKMYKRRQEKMENIDREFDNLENEAAVVVNPSKRIKST